MKENDTLALLGTYLQKTEYFCKLFDLPVATVTLHIRIRNICE